MMQSAPDMFLRKFITVGRLTVRWPDGRTQAYAGRPGPEAGVVLRDRRTVWRLILNPKLSVGEAYMDGGLVSLGGSIHDVLVVVLANLRTNPKGLFVTWLRRTAAKVWRPIDQFNARARARRNVAHHYDLNGRLYSLFLDRDRQYSCAYFVKGTETLEEAQEAKKRHIAAKLCLDRPGLSVLDIGCGWGGMALTFARDYGATVTGITLSTEQLAEAQARAEAEGLHAAAIREPMVTDPSKTMPPLRARGAAFPLAGLVRLLARQAAREVIACSLDKTQPATSATAVTTSAPEQD
jgi:cyclopropane-fatty-acyl-phospholipid synthase